MGEELGVGGVQVRVPPRRRIALPSGRCHQTRAAGACAPRLAANLCDSSRFEQQYTYPPCVAQIAGHLGGIDGSHHADRDGDTACVPRTRIVDVAGRPRRRVITAPAPRAHRATQTRDARLAKLASPEAVDGSRRWRTSTWTGARSDARTRARRAGSGSRGRADHRTGRRRRPVA